MKTRHVRHEFFLSNFAINSMKKKTKKDRSFVLWKSFTLRECSSKHWKEEKKRDMGEKIFQRRKFLKCLRKRAVSGSEAGY